MVQSLIGVRMRTKGVENPKKSQRDTVLSHISYCAFVEVLKRKAAGDPTVYTQKGIMLCYSIFALNLKKRKIYSTQSHGWCQLSLAQGISRNEILNQVLAIKPRCI